MEVDGRNFDDMYKHWDRSGKNDFLKLFKDKFEYCNGKVAYENVNKGVIDIKKLLCNLCWASIKGQLKVDQVVSTFNEVADVYNDAPLLLADLFSVLEVELSCYEDNDDRERFNNLVLGSLNVVPDCLLKEKLDPEVLENMGLLQSKTAFQQKYVKTKTKIYYKQQKFNLLREETEGYAKLITELSQEFPVGFRHNAILKHIQSLIGCFNLDPNRVLDIILDVFECRPEKEDVFVPLLSEYALDRVTLCHILGFKFHFYQHTPDVVTNPSLYHMTALLLRHNLISLEHLMPHLIPSDSEMLDIHKKELAEARQHCQKMNVTLLSEKSTSENKDEKSDQDDKNNQKLGLCEALLDVGCWEHALTIISAFPMYSAMSPSVAQSLCRLIHFIIDPVYLKYSGIPQEILKHRSLPASYPSSVKQAKTYSDLIALTFPLVKQLGSHLSCDPVLLVKINRIAKTYMLQNNSSNDTSCDVFCHLMMIYDECILPSLTLMPGNCCISEDIWGFMKLLKYEHRYRLYGQWRNESYSRIPVLMKAHAEVLSSTKYIMKRLVKENVKQVGRQIGKLSHRAPGVIFEQILAQIQRYDNFILPVVDSMKYITSLSYDVLVYTVIEALASPDKERLKTDGSNISTWLQSLANFSGYVMKKYQVDIAGLLHYILNQLKAGRSCDLYVMREVIQKMAGIEVSEEVTNDQLMSMSGGELLKQEAGYFTQVRNTKKSSSRLMDCLNEQNLTMPYCILMSQQRNAIIFPKSDEPQETDARHVKLIGKLFDQCQDTLVQFISFLSMQMTPEELKRKLPNLLELSKDYFITPEVSFALWRRIFTNEISIRAEELRKAEKKDKNAIIASSQSSKMLKYYEAVESVMVPIRQDFIEPMMSPKLWEELNLQFYTTFWSLELYDLEVPTAAYENQVKIHQAQLQAIEDNKDLAQSKKKKEKERCTSLIEKLNEEEKRQEEHIKMVMQRLRQERDQWFSTKLAKHSTITAILQCCLFPRCCFTAIDAIYCAKFLYTLHNLKTPNFSSLICYDRIFGDITWSVSSCTENEAHRYGRFLNAVLGDMMMWHSDKSVYEKECANFPGFMTVFRSTQTNQNTVADHLDYENFRHVVHKWHFGLTRVSVNCLESNDYIQMRNILIILTKVIPNYPKIVKLGVALEKRVEKVIEQEKDNREDLYHLAFGYCGKMKITRKSWVQDHQFHKKEQDNKAKNAAGTVPSNQQNDTNSASPMTAIKTEDDKNSLDIKSAPKQTIKTRNNEDEDKSNLTGKSSDVPSRGLPEKVTASSSRTPKDQSKISRDKADQKDSATTSSVDKKDGTLELQRSADDSPVMRKIRVGDQQVKFRDSNDWSGDHGHQQEESIASNETSDLNHHRSSRQPPDERDLKRRKIEGGSGSKESISHSDIRERSRRSPNYEERRGSQLDWDRKRDNSKEHLDRKRQSTGTADSDRNENMEGRESKRHKGDDGSSSREGSSKMNGNDDKRRESRTREKKEEVDKLPRASGKEEDTTKESKTFHMKDDSALKERAKDHGSRIKKTISTKESERRLSSEKHSKKPKAR